MQAELYYRHSGRFSPVSAFSGAVAGAIAGALAGFVYAYAISYIPLVYLNALIAAGYGLLMGYVVNRAMRWLHVRNAGAIFIVAILASLVGLYVSWAVWVHVLLGKASVDVPTLALLRRPSALWRCICMINETGAWTLGRHSSEPVTGVFLWCVWGTEALLICGIAVVAGVGVLATPFCEACQHWCKKRSPNVLLADSDPVGLIARLEQKDFACLSEIGPQPAGTASWLVLEIHLCPECGETNTVTLKQAVNSVDKKGKTTTKETELMDRLVLNREETAALLATCDSLQVLPEPSAEATEIAPATTEQ